MNDTPPAATTPSTLPSHTIAVLAAVARNGVIGLDNRLPWRLPADLRRFRELTMGHAMVMGRKTWQSIGKPLAGRQNIVVSGQRHDAVDGVAFAGSLAAALAAVEKPDPVFVIGGEAIYREVLPLARRLYLTEIECDFEGDARFPAYDRGQWRETARETRRLEGPAGFTYHFADYERTRD